MDLRDSKNSKLDEGFSSSLYSDTDMWSIPEQLGLKITKETVMKVIEPGSLYLIYIMDCTMTDQTTGKRMETYKYVGSCAIGRKCYKNSLQSHVDGTASWFTAQHRPVSIEQQFFGDEFDVNTTVRRLMKVNGIESVRGGYYQDREIPVSLYAELAFDFPIQNKTVKDIDELKDEDFLPTTTQSASSSSSFDDTGDQLASVFKELKTSIGIKCVSESNEKEPPSLSSSVSVSDSTQTLITVTPDKKTATKSSECFAFQLKKKKEPQKKKVKRELDYS